MALILEDGTVVANANSYVTVADADTYHALYANTDWAAVASQDKEDACIIATQAVDLIFGEQFASFKYQDVQSLLWPRYSFYTVDGNLIQYNQIPSNLKVAVYQLALLHTQGNTLVADLDPASYATEESLKVGELSISRKYKQAVDRTIDRKVSLILRPVLKDLKSVRMVR
jgi:hypothetical protein